jgi:hypothetical protein
MMHAELRRAGVTLELLHLEYLREHPDGYRYTAFCDHYRKWLDRRGLVMRQHHKAGDKTFVDYSGNNPHPTARSMHRGGAESGSAGQGKAANPRLVSRPGARGAVERKRRKHRPAAMPGTPT